MEREKFIVMTLRGRLGNQLFGFASGYGFAARCGGELLFYDASHLGRDAYDLAQVVGPSFRLASPRQLLRVGCYDFATPLSSTISGLVWKASAARARRSSSPRLIIQDELGSPFEFHQSLLEVRAPVMFSGYFHTERYFSEFAPEISSQIHLPAIDGMGVPREDHPLVSVTFRRGDYVDHDWNLPLGYYDKAFAHCVDVLPDARFLVFSDDPEFVELALPWIERYGPATSAVKYSRDALTQLAMLASCDHHVIANSTFCWWGAWLGEQRHSEPTMVIAPEGWTYGDEGIIPDRWLTLPTG